MKGYKVFIKTSKGEYMGPSFSCESNWVIRAGSTLTARFVNERNDVACGAGVNFWTTKKDALMCFDECFWRGKAVVYEVKTLDKCYGNKKHGKLRTHKLKLVRRLKNPIKELS